jgi:hypothetical protein
MAVKMRLRTTSTKPRGHHPVSLRASEMEAPSLAIMSQITAKVQMIQDSVTALILARITDGASRLRVADGRVAGDT